MIIINIKEYMLIVNNEVYLVYANSERDALTTFGKVCFEFRNTDNISNKEYWDSLRGLMLADKYTIIENTDFRGTRKVI